MFCDNPSLNVKARYRGVSDRKVLNIYMNYRLLLIQALTCFG